MKGSKRTWRKLFGALIVAIFVHFVFFYRKKPFVREVGRFPFLWSKSTNATVKHYIRANPANHILLVAGPYRSGKSRLLETIAETLIQERNQLPIVVRADRAESVEELADQIKYDAIRALNALAPRLGYGEVKSLEGVSLTRAESSVEFGSEGLSRAAQLVGRAADALLGDEPERFFEFMAAMSVVVRPYVIVHGLEQMQRLTGRNGSVSGAVIVNRSLAHVLERRQYASFVPLSVEIKDTSLFLREQIGDAFQIAYTPELENPLEQVNVIRSLFTKEEAKELIHEFGGHYGSFEAVFEEMKMGTPIPSIVKSVNERLDKEIEAMMTNRTSEWWRWLNTIRPVSKEILEVPEVRAMLERGYLWVNQTGHIFPASAPVKKRILALADGPTFNVKEFHKQEMEMLGRAFVNESSTETDVNATETEPEPTAEAATPEPVPETARETETVPETSPETEPVPEATPESEGDASTTDEPATETATEDTTETSQTQPEETV